MKKGWKTRIDERRYFEEKQEKKADAVFKRLKMEAHIVLQQKLIDQKLKALDRVAASFRPGML